MGSLHVVQALIAFFLLPVLVVAEGDWCSLDGQWYDPSAPRDAQLIFRFSTIPIYGTGLTAVTTNGQWSTGKVLLNATSSSTAVITTYLDNGDTQVGSLNLSSCVQINWTTPSGPVWLKIPEVNKVHVVFMNHLDVGYNGIPKTGFINNVLNTYFQEYFPRAVRLAAEMKTLPGGFIYTTHPWLISLYLNCPPNMVLNGIRLQCPSQFELKAFEEAIHLGYIAWHAGPMNLQVELMNEAVFEVGLQISADLDAQFGRNTTVLSQRDVPGLTAAVIPILSINGIQAITVGVNSGSAPPAVPDLFMWEYQGQSIIAMWHPGGYPGNPGNDVKNAGGLSIMDCVIEEHSKQALAFAFRTDNSGPPESIDEIQAYYEILHGEFPDATVSASTFDSFVQGIETGFLPIVKGEIADTWIQGAASDPRKLAEFQAASAAFMTCIQDKQCKVTDSQVKNASRFLIKLPEHTWGLPGVYDTVNWTNAAFEKARKQANYVNSENSWVEQRQFLNLTLEASYGHPLYDYISNALEDLNPVVPSIAGFKSVDPSQTFKLINGTVTIGFDKIGGWIDNLVYSNTYTFASSKNPLAVLSYHTYNESDYHYMNSIYDYHGNSGYDKPNSTENAHPNTTIYSTILDKLYQSEADPAIFIMQFHFDQFAHTYYGAPGQVWILLTVSSNQTSTESELVSLSFELVWVNKTATRLAEATMFSFYPQRQSNSSLWEGYVQKIGTWIDLSSVIKNGSQYQHIAQEAALTDSESNIQITLRSPDTPLVCPIVSKVKSPTPFPAPLDPIDPSLIEGIAFNLHNNIWNTNYALWYPFVGSDKNFKARYTVNFGKLGKSRI